MYQPENFSPTNILTDACITSYRTAARALYILTTASGAPYRDARAYISAPRHRDVYHCTARSHVIYTAISRARGIFHRTCYTRGRIFAHLGTNFRGDFSREELIGRTKREWRTWKGGTRSSLCFEIWSRLERESKVARGACVTWRESS